MSFIISCIYVTYICLIISGCAAFSRKSKETELAKETAIDTVNIVRDSTIFRDTVKVDTSSSSSSKKPGLSPANEIMIKACDNYIKINPQSPKIAEVITLKASVYYNNKLFEQSRKIYQKIIEDYPKANEAIDAIRMIAQSYYEEKKFDKAQEWYRKLKKASSEEGGKSEAVVRIAESIFRMAEMYEKEQRFSDAAAQYERVALEFPDAVIADVSLFNAGLSYEKLAEWSRAILMYQRLKQRYQGSNIVYKSMFRTAKCYEKLEKWDDAGQTYLRLVANYPLSDLTSTSLYNAGFCFENAGKLMEAAATFEKLAKSFPKSKDAADVLFKAGEIYGKLKNWEGVTRVNQEFSERYGSDKDRIVQAQCMVGVALFMQGKQSEAISQLQKAVSIYTSLNNPSPSNKYYAANAQFTIGDIYHERMNKIKLVQPKNVYKKQLGEKSDLLDKTINMYSHVIKYGISEWTTRAVYQIGETYESFAVDVFKQERIKNLSIEESLAMEMGIAKAVEEYFVEDALHYYEQNVKLGIKEKIENKHIINSRKKLTYLPYIAGQNYLALVDIARKFEGKKNLEGFALIAQKLQLLQKIAPFQERAIGLFLKSIEMATMYQEHNEFFKKASNLITKTTFTVAETYADVVSIARGAPIPKGFDEYEDFVYKTKLLKQIEGYEESALSNYLKALKISQLYEINDEYIEKTKKQMPKLLFTRACCYDVLCISAFNNPPYPANISEAEKDEYRARFEEIALTYQELAFDIYKAILKYAEQKYATGDFVNHAYIRLYQNSPEEYGVKTEKLQVKSISSGPKWKCNIDSFPNWYTLEFNDQDWLKVSKEEMPETVLIKGFPKNIPSPMWYENNSASSKPNKLFFRLAFYVKEPPHKVKFFLTAIDEFSVFINEERLQNDTSSVQWNVAQSWDLSEKLRQGKNVIAVKVKNNIRIAYGLYPALYLTVTSYDYLPKFPGEKETVDKKAVTEDIYKFPEIKNFEMEK